jgi:hypothetical protein
MEAQPFKPFRVCITDDKTYDITNHDMMFVNRNATFIGVNLDANDLAEYMVQCAFIHITRVQDIVPAKAA